jgi:hypothetical protein
MPDTYQSRADGAPDIGNADPNLAVLNRTVAEAMEHARRHQAAVDILRPHMEGHPDRTLGDVFAILTDDERSIVLEGLRARRDSDA